MGNKKIDIIIVGKGIAGTILAFYLLKKNKSFIVIDSIKPNQFSSSKIALGVYNPLVLKWITKSWEADSQIEELFNFCDLFERFFLKKIHYKKNIHRILHTNYEVNNWNDKQSLNKLKKYMSSELKSLPFSKELFGVVLNSGWVDVNLMLDVFLNYVKEKNLFINEKFDYKRVFFQKDCIEYKDFYCKNIVFCEGIAMNENPFFNNLSLVPTKGETLKIYSPKLKLKKILHTGVMIIPLGDDLYHIGSTFDRDDLTRQVTEDGKKQMIKKLPFLKNIEYKIIEHHASHRPATIDRKPILGSHVKYKNLFVFNGLGSRGILQSPYLSKELIDLMFEGKEIMPEISINRFK